LCQGSRRSQLEAFLNPRDVARASQR
jgi:hypothetical protein